MSIIIVLGLAVALLLGLIKMDPCLTGCYHFTGNLTIVLALLRNSR
jgi:hypothetical protein